MIRHLAIVLLSTLLLISMVTADTAPFQISTTGSASNADIDGDHMVWLYNVGSNNNSVYSHNLATGDTVILMRDDHKHKQLPRVSGQQAVWSTDWTKEDNHQNQIWLADLTTGETQQLVKQNQRIYSLDIDDDIVAWTDTGVWLRNLITGETLNLVPQDWTVRRFVSVSVPWVTWLEPSNWVMGYNISTTQVVSLMRRARHVSSAGDVLLYASTPPTATLYAMSLTTGVTTTITSTVPAIARTDGETVVYQSDGLWVYDLTTGETARFMDGAMTDPSVSGDVVIWRQQDENEQWDIWGAGVATTEVQDTWWAYLPVVGSGE